MRFYIMEPGPAGVLYLMGDLGLNHSFKALDPERPPADGYLLSWPSAEEAEKAARKWLPSVEGVIIGTALVPSREELLNALRRRYDDALVQRRFNDEQGRGDDSSTCDAIWLQILKLSIRLPGDP